MGILRVADPLEGAAQRFACEALGRSAGQHRAHRAVRPQRQRAGRGHAPVAGPELPAQPGALDRDLGQRRGRHFLAQQLAGDPVGLVFVLARQGEGPGREAREVPEQESLGGGGYRTAVVAHFVMQAGPALASAVDPGGEAAVIAAQVSVLVCQHGQESRPVQREQQGQADGQVVAGAAEQAPSRELADAGVEFAIQQHAVDGRPLDLLADALQGLEQRGSVGPGQLHALRLVQPAPQRAQAGDHQTAGSQQQRKVPALELALCGCEHRPPQDRRRQQQAADDPGVAEGREGRDTAPVGLAVFRAGVFAQSHQADEIGLLQKLLPVFGQYYP
ncbi:MAG: hypothetical protein JWQ13_2562 [Ramlibacter sp.]|nr:hypothetical protein [Ramlibacter sp.]